MRKKTIVIEYLEVIDFLKSYNKKDLKEERKSLESMCGMKLGEIALTEDYYDLIKEFTEFAEEVGYNYCPEHQIFHEYENCPLCTMEEFIK